MSALSIHSRTGAPRERGAVLFVSLIFLLVLTLIAVMLARSQTTEERLAQNDANHDLALETAGATLRFAQMNIAEGTYTGFTQNTGGLYQFNPTSSRVYTPSIWSQTNAVLSYTGPTLNAISPAPEFFIEQMPPAPKPGTPLGGCSGYGGNGCAQIYQITAHSTGANSTANATLRSTYEVE